MALISILAMLSPEWRRREKLNESANSHIWCRVAGESAEEQLLWKRSKSRQDVVVVGYLFLGQNYQA